MIFEINSPCGSPYKSKELSEKIENLDCYTGARIKEIKDSGAYWIASACDEIVADELSTIGGMGTLSIRPNLSKLLDKYGIDIDVKFSGKYRKEDPPFFQNIRRKRRTVRMYSVQLVGLVFSQSDRILLDLNY